MPSLFSFEPSALLFGATPVENVFLLEYMPKAKGEYVKVYLYGLMKCLQASDEPMLADMMHDLDMTEDEIQRAFRYWERLNLVHRVSDNPPAWQYASASAQHLQGSRRIVDEEYDNFRESLYAVCGNERSLRESDFARAYEWKEEMKLPVEVILMLLQHMISIHGKNFSFQTADKVASQLAEEGVKSIADAEQVLGREKKVWDGSSKVLRRFNQFRNPTEDELQLYTKWLKEWHFSQEAILEACSETPKGTRPSFGYLDGILSGIQNRSGKKAFASAKDVKQAQEDDQQQRAPLRALLDTLGLKDLPINKGTLSIYADMQTVYPDEIIMMAAKECSRIRGCTLDMVAHMLDSWKERGLHTAEDIQQYISSVNAMNTQIKQLYTLWKLPYKAISADRTLLDRWLSTWHISWEEILRRAPEAAGSERPMAYLNALLDPTRTGTIKSEAPAHTKRVTEQNYDQRVYEDDSEKLPAAMAAALGLENHHAE